MSSKASTMLFVFVGATAVGLALAHDPHCRGACHQFARNLTRYGIKGLFPFL
jgi:predicted secreted Zn-dependent protease